VTAIDYFAWLVFIVIIVSVVAGFIVLAQLPGKIARKNRHPQVAAINTASWLGLLMTFGIVWVLAMVWASMVPVEPARSSGPNVQADSLEERIKALDLRIRTLEEQKS